MWSRKKGVSEIKYFYWVQPICLPCIGAIHIYQPPTKYNRKVIFSVCLSVHQGRWGYSDLWFQVPSLPLVPGPFSGGRHWKI